MAENDFIAPIVPTGSGVADLEIAREQDALAADGELGGAVAGGSDNAAEQTSPPEQAPMTLGTRWKDASRWLRLRSGYARPTPQPARTVRP